MMASFHFGRPRLGSAYLAPMVAEIPHHAHLDKHHAEKREIKSFSAGLSMRFSKVMKHMQVFL
jgi:hypothetical protein